MPKNSKKKKKYQKQNSYYYKAKGLAGNYHKISKNTKGKNSNELIAPPRKGKHLYSIIFIILILIFIIGLVYSACNITKWYYSNVLAKKEMDYINDNAIVEDIEDSETTQIIEQEEKPPEFDPYWDYIKMSLTNVDFQELKKANPQTVGWVSVGGTNINYPFVQTDDNDYYLSHSFNKVRNSFGWVFMDYRNNSVDFDKNTILYGHSILTGSIFGTLKNVLTEKWQTTDKYHIVKVSTEYENTLWQVFSVYHTPNTNDYLKINFRNNDAFLEFTQMLIDRSEYDFKTSVSENDQIITLSTCYNNTGDKIVLHAKLIKKEVKEKEEK